MGLLEHRVLVKNLVCWGFSLIFTQLESVGKAQRAARPASANATVHFLLSTDWLYYSHLANKV